MKDRKHNNPKEKGQTTIYNTLHKTKDRAIRNQLKIEDELMCSEG
jgi:hypothetical protein